MGYVYLAGAIILEIVATNLLKASVGFTRIVPTIGSLVVYALCFYLFALSLKTVDLNLAYAVWCGLGIVATAIISVLFWKETINWVSLIGLAFIVIGVILVSWFKPS